MKYPLSAFISGIALFCISLSFSSSLVLGRTHPDQVTSLPGLKSTLDFQHFAGYLNVNATNNRNLFYWFTKAANSSNDLVLWLNGGPGCSSVSGFFTENGPFVVNSDGNIKLNDFAWNTRANVLWLEAPAGVRNPFLTFRISTHFHPRLDFLTATSKMITTQTTLKLQRTMSLHLLRSCKSFLNTLPTIFT